MEPSRSQSKRLLFLVVAGGGSKRQPDNNLLELAGIPLVGHAVRRALEAGELGELPGGVFRRGFVRSYLGALGMEEGPWMRRFEESCRVSGVSEPAVSEWAQFAENVKNSRIVRRRRMGIRWAGVGVTLAALALGGWCGWRLATHRGLLPAIPIWRHLKSSVDNAPSR